MKKGFTLIEILIAICFIGVILVTVSGVFVQGNNAIKKGRTRSTAINIADKKVAHVHEMVDLARADVIIGSSLINVLTDGDSAGSTVKFNGSVVVPGNDYIIWPDGTTPAIPIESQGTFIVKGSGSYDYKLTITDYNYPAETFLKKVRIEVTWKETGLNQKFFMESLISKQANWPTPSP